MDLLVILKAVVMGLVEGVTEFLPVSSTGHLIVAGDLLGFAARDNVFEVVIQTGAIFAVILLYFRKLWGTLIGLPTDPAARRFAVAVAVGFLPAAGLGLLLHDFIKEHLFNMTVVSVALVAGGVFMLWVERLPLKANRQTVDEIDLPTALKIGFCQCLAMIPGVSRSGATIIGALLLGVERKAAAEFSFYLAIPTLIGAGALDMVKDRDQLMNGDLLLIAVGMAAAFISAVLVIRGFIHWLGRHGFGVFAWYRIVAGVLLLAFAAGT